MLNCSLPKLSGIRGFVSGLAKIRVGGKPLKLYQLQIMVSIDLFQGLNLGQIFRDSQVRNKDGIVEVKVESDEEDSDIQIVSDDECKVIETSRPPIKRKKNFKDYQHEIPGKKSKESDIIDLASSDEEEIAPIQRFIETIATILYCLIDILIIYFHS